MASFLRDSFPATAQHNAEVNRFIFKPPSLECFSAGSQATSRCTMSHSLWSTHQHRRSLVCENAPRCAWSADRPRIKDRIRQRLTEIELRGVIQRVTHPTDFVLPIVIVAKQDGDLRLCVRILYCRNRFAPSSHCRLFTPRSIHCNDGSVWCTSSGAMNFGKLE